MTKQLEESLHSLGYAITGESIVGGSSTVYPAEHLMSGDRVALKVLAPGHDSARLSREAKILANIEHPGIARFREHLVVDSSDVLAVDWVPGDRLSALMTNGPLPLSNALEIAGQLGAALDSVHSAGVVHRDLSPANILVDTSSGRPVARIIDFGVSRSADDDAVTVEGTIAGTARYLAPETIRGEAPRPQTDQYSVAVLLYELLTGSWPFPKADAFVAAMHHHLHSIPTPIREIDPTMPSTVEDGLLRALSKDPADRFSTVTDLVASLDTSASVGKVWTGRARSALGGRVDLAVFACIAVAVIAAVGWIAAQSGASEPGIVEATSTTSEAGVVDVVPETSTSTTDGAERFALPVWESGFAESLVCNLVTEADFEDVELPQNFYLDPENPTRERVVVGEGVDGSGALEIGDPNLFGIYGEILPADPDTPYIFSLNSRIDGRVTESEVWIDWLDAEFNVIGESNALNIAGRPPGQHALVTQPSPSNAAYGVPRIYKNNDSGVLFIDELVFARSDSDCADILLQ